MRRSWAFDTIVLALVLGLWPVKLFRDAPDMRVTSEPVTRGSIPAPIVATGVVRAAATITISPKLPGAVQAIEAMPHTMVHAGDVLARLDANQYRAALAAAQGALADANDNRRRRELALGDAESRRAAAADLTAARLVAPAALDPLEVAVMQARSDLLASEEHLAAAHAELDRAAAELQETVLTAPADGLILSIAQGGPTISIATEINHVQVEAALDGETGQAVQTGDSADVARGDFRARGRVVAVPRAGDVSDLVLDVPASIADLPPGTFVRVALDG